MTLVQEKMTIGLLLIQARQNNKRFGALCAVKNGIDSHHWKNQTPILGCQRSEECSEPQPHQRQHCSSSSQLVNTGVVNTGALTTEDYRRLRQPDLLLQRVLEVMWPSMRFRVSSTQQVTCRYPLIGSMMIRFWTLMASHLALIEHQRWSSGIGQPHSKCEKLSTSVGQKRNAHRFHKITKVTSSKPMTTVHFDWNQHNLKITSLSSFTSTTEAISSHGGKPV